jgi:hypothetical protein
MFRRIFLLGFALLFASGIAFAEIGDPQLKTDHPYYPGELASSTFERLFEAQAKLYEHVTGQPVKTEQDKVLAAWLWRNTHYWHGEPGREDLWGDGFEKGPDGTSREYWGGLYGNGFALCGTTHAQWVPEMQALLGHNRARTVGTAGHNSFEVFLQGGSYKEGKWVLLDHDISTVIFDEKGDTLLSIAEIAKKWNAYATRDYAGNKRPGWLPVGLHPEDGGVYAAYNVAEYFPGYAGPPPIVHLRRGESLRRYVAPGLEDGKTFVFWGRNYNTGKQPGPERAHTWVNQPDKMYRSKSGAGYKPGQARYANAVYTYSPDFASGDYREGVVEESDDHVTLEFSTPYVIGATPASTGPWDIYKPGGKNGLVISGSGDIPVSISLDRGATWRGVGNLVDELDATDHAKGFRQYWLKFDASAKTLAKSKLSIRTTCQMNSSLIPHIQPGKNTISYASSKQAIVSAGPTLAQARAHKIAGDFDSPKVTLELAAPRELGATTVYAAAHVRSSAPPDPSVAYFIEYSTDGGKSWQSIVSDWKITRRGDEPKDFWSQSFIWGEAKLPKPVKGPVQVRFRNTGGKHIARAEMHLAYEVPTDDSCQVTFAFADGRADMTRPHEHSFVAKAGQDTATHDFGAHPELRWVEMKPAAK